jgi:acetoin utilization deacetylase AcuC-like enzyme
LCATCSEFARTVVVVLVLATNPELDQHDTGPEHPEQPARLRAALSGIDAAGIRDAVIRTEPRRASEEELALVHPRPYLEALRVFCEAGGGTVDPDTVAVPGSWDTALLAAGGGLAAIECLDEGAGDFAFVAARPPGHHASATRAMGFCLLNNIAVSAALLAERGERVLIVDWDVHHGNGTEDIFWDDPRVLYVSTHQSRLYPGTGAADETGGPNAEGLNVNIPLPSGATGDVVRRALERVAGPVVERFGPTWVLVSAGFDAHRADPLASLRLTAGDFSDLASTVTSFCPGLGRLILFLEGGYDLDALRMSVGSTLATLLGQTYRPEPSSTGGPGDEMIEMARRIHETG